MICLCSSSNPLKSYFGSLLSFNDKFSVLEAVFEGIAGFCTQLLKERLRQNQDYSIADLP